LLDCRFAVPPRAGYEVVVVPIKDGHATGEDDDFLTGFVTRAGVFA